MDYNTFKIKNEVDFYRLINQLKDEEIPHRYKILGDSAMPVIGFNDCYGEIAIQADYKIDLLKFLITENIEFEEKEEVRKTWKISKVLLVTLLIYSFFITLLFIKYWNIEKKNSFDKNFRYTWNWDNTALSVIDKESNNTVVLFIDKNRDYNYEVVRNFTHIEGIMTESIDNDENGYFEKVVSFGLDQKQTETLIDNDEDGLFDMRKIFLENGDSLILTDRNSNGLFELRQ